MPGHESGHAHGAAPVGLDWDGLVRGLVAEHGGWAALVDELQHRARGLVELPTDPGSVEKGLRRLAAREHRPGGSYGRWVLRFFGLPADIERWARWLGQYHTRFHDLPTGLRLEQLRLWDRPPISESPLSAWIDVGMAGVFFRQGDGEGCRQRLERAAARAKRAGPAALVEVKLFQARLRTDDGDRAASRALHDEVGTLLEHPDLDPEDRNNYLARWLGQRAFQLTQPPRGQPEDPATALALFEAIPDAPDQPFVMYRKHAGLAWCTWRLGDPVEGARLARLACQHAGDGGLVRFRVMGLNILARMVPPDEARDTLHRAARLARMLGDEELLVRVQRRLKRL